MRDFDRFLLHVVYDIPVLLFVVDPDDGRIVYANRTMRATLGEECVGRRFSEQFRGAGGEHYFISYAQQHGLGAVVVEPEAPPLQSEYYDDDGEHWYHVLQRPIEWIDGSRKFVFVLDEIDALKRLQKELSEAHAALAFKNRELEVAAKSDRLTQLYNRHHLDAVLEQELQRYTRFGKPFAVFIMDCDHFKWINDSHGHPVGDLVLIELARLLRLTVRATDTVGRWGGEEFLAILPETDRAGAVAVAEKLRRAVEQQRFDVVGQLSASFGVAEVRPRELAKDLVGRADVALYRAKAAGRNRVESEP